jgi:hypothetical protein
MTVNAGSIGRVTGLAKYGGDYRLSFQQYVLALTVSDSANTI